MNSHLLHDILAKGGWESTINEIHGGNMNELNKLNPSQTVSFSGHRPEQLPGHGDPNTLEAQMLITALQKHIAGAIRSGKHVYIHGAMAGFDIMAAEQVLDLKKQYPHIQLISVAPYSVDFFSRERCWTPEWIHRAREVFRQHNFGISLSEHYRPGIYYERNRVIVDHSSELICYHDGGKGGTEQTIRYAKSKSLHIHNLF